MAVCALLIRFDARTGKEDEVEGLLRSIQPPLGLDASPHCWLALRMAPEIYALFATFEKDEDRQVFLSGLTRSWNDRTSELLSRPPVIEEIEVVARSRVPPVPSGIPTSGAAGETGARTRAGARRAGIWPHCLTYDKHNQTERLRGSVSATAPWVSVAGP